MPIFNPRLVTKDDGTPIGSQPTKTELDLIEALTAFLRAATEGIKNWAKAQS
jgi:hypothetical protein